MKTMASGICMAVGLLLCACSHNGSSVSGLTPSQAQQMSSKNAKVTESKPPPLTANTRFAAGQLAEAQENYDAAIDQYQAALKLDSKHLPSLYRMGVLYAQRKQFDKAINTWNQYLAATNYCAAAYANLGFCYELAENPKMAVAAYERGISKDSRNLPCRLNYGLMLARTNHIQAAVRMWDPVMSEAEIDYNIAGVYDLSGRKQEARAEYKKALDLDPSLTDAKARLAAIQ